MQRQMLEKSAAKSPARHQGAKDWWGHCAGPAPSRGAGGHLPESAAKASDPCTGLAAPRNPARRRLPKLESEGKAGVTPQSKGQAGSCFIRTQGGSDRLVESGHFCPVTDSRLGPVTWKARDSVQGPACEPMGPCGCLQRERGAGLGERTGS